MHDADILLVEDNPGDATLVEHYLSNPSVRAFLGETSLTHVESLSAAEECLDAATFDVVLLDLGLPESAGIETVNRFEAFDVAVPVIVLTGLDDTETAVEAIQSGAQDFLPKGDLDGDRLARSLRYAVERHKQERTLARRNEQLDFFNSILRHDMQNGLNVVMGKAQLLEAELSDPEQVAYANDIFEWSRNISDLATKVRRILDTVAEEGGASREPVDAVPVVAEEAVRVDAMSDRVSVVTDLPESCSVLANDLLGDVVGNLLTNAVEHTDEATRVEVTLEDCGHVVCLRVSDDGPGIPAERQAAVFDRGEQRQGSAGTGFGLYFVSSMVESYGGEVDVTDSERGGAQFVVDLPAA
jgi:signal transduction histidine kinase